MERVPKGMDVINVLDRMYGLNVFTMRMEVFSYKIYYKLCQSNSHTMKYFLYCTNVCQNFSNSVIQVGKIWTTLIQFCVVVIQIDMIYNYKKIAPNFFKIENEVTFRVLIFTYFYTMPQCAPIGGIRRSRDGIKKSESPLPINLQDYAFNGSRWVHINAVIVIPPGSNSFYLSTTPYTDEGDFLITVSQSINGSARLFIMNECIFSNALFLSQSIQNLQL